MAVASLGAGEQGGEDDDDEEADEGGDAQGQLPDPEAEALDDHVGRVDDR